MDLMDGLHESTSEFGRLVDGTRADQLDDPAACADSTVRDANLAFTGRRP